MWALWTWLFSFFFILALLILIGFQLVCLVDLEYDYMNPYDSAMKINRAVLPEFITHGVLTVVYLLTGHWLMFVLSLPYLIYNVHDYMGGRYLMDVTEIYNQLDREKKKRYFKMGYILIAFVFSLFWLLFNLEDQYD